MERIELLAPAGNLNILKTAVDAGADAVYVGIGAYNARMNAENFDFDSLREGCIYAGRRSSKVYVALNILVNDSETDDAVMSAVQSYECGASGIMVQDIGLAAVIHKKYPEIPLFASTQMNVYSEDSFRQLRDLGIKRIVLPRELSMEEIKSRVKAAERAGIETEVFAHGAVCVCTSGLCLFSSMNKSGSRSGNRGLCAQPCRQEYKLYSDEDEIRSGHLLSPKDRAVINYIDELISCGVTSLKIEGRMREESYVLGTVKAYRTLIDAYDEGTLDAQLISGIKNDLLVSFNRGGDFTDQYLSGKKSENLNSGEYVGKYGILAGKYIGKDKNKGIIKISLNKNIPEIEKGDYLSLRKNDTEVCSFPVGKITNFGNTCEVKGLHPDTIAKLDGRIDVYLMNTRVSLDKKNIRRTPVNISIDASEEGVLRANARVVRGIAAESFSEYEIDLDTSFDGVPVSRERVSEQMRKTGNTAYEVEEVYFVSDSDIKCRISDINDLRRGLLEGLDLDIDYNLEHSFVNSEFIDDTEPSISNRKGTVSEMTIVPNLSSAEDSIYDIDTDIICFSVYDTLYEAGRNRIADLAADHDIYIFLPDFFHDNINSLFKKNIDIIKSITGSCFKGVIDGRFFGKKENHVLSAGCNIFNRNTLYEALKVSEGAFISYELTSDEVVSMLSDFGLREEYKLFLLQDGLIPWMQSDFCPVGRNRKNCKSCMSGNSFRLTQSGSNEKECITITHRADCSSTIYGPCKNLYTDEQCEKITESGFDVIKCNVLI